MANFKNIFEKKKSVITFSLLCYIVACCFPSYLTENITRDNTVGGWFDLLTGWFAIFVMGKYAIFGLAWYANITYIVSIHAFAQNHHKRFYFFNALTIILGLFFSQCPEIIVDGYGEMGKFTLVEGYWLWLTSFFILLVGGITEHTLSRKQ